jgi:hypothetical protein
MGTNNTLINTKEKHFCQETLTKKYLMLYSFSQETLTKKFPFWNRGFGVAFLKTIHKKPCLYGFNFEIIVFNGLFS